MTVWYSKPRVASQLTALVSLLLILGCNPPTKITSLGTLGQPVSVKGDLQILLHQPDKSNHDVYAAIFASLETTSVLFCASESSSSSSNCDGKKTYTTSFQKRSESGFYFISSEPLNFAEGTRLLFLSYISNNGTSPSQRGQSVFYAGNIQDSESDDSDTNDTDTETINNSNGGIIANDLIALFKQLLGSGGTTTPSPTPSPPPIISTPTPSPTGQTDALVPNPDNVQLSSSEFEVIRLTNAERQRQGKQALIVQQKIMATARESSRLMKQQNNMVHGLTSGWNGENIANGYSSPQQVVQGWINSPGHYRNMMGSFKYIGVGDTIDQGGSVFWTQQFNY